MCVLSGIRIFEFQKRKLQYQFKLSSDFMIDTGIFFIKTSKILLINDSFALFPLGNNYLSAPWITRTEMMAKLLPAIEMHLLLKIM